MESITIKDIAKICKVGVSTVSRAINNHPDINSETKEMIMRVIKDNNYIPNNSARNLKRTDARAIAILVKGITNPFFSDMIKVMEKEIMRRKYTLVLRHVEFNEDEVEVAVELIKEKRLRGIIFLGGYINHPEEKVDQLTVPFVLSTIGAIPNMMSKQMYSSISVDDEKESYKMIDYLIKSGHKDIVIIAAHEDDVSIGKLRLEGYKRALSENSISVREELILTMKKDIDDYSMENGYQVTKDFLEKNITFTAIYAISDTLAVGACRALTETGKKIPEQCAVAGFDGIDIGRFYNPSITTIKQPVKEMAMETIKILFDVIRKQAPHQHIVFPGELLVRESTTK